MKKVNLVSRTFGRWTVIAPSHKSCTDGFYWECKCVCGTVREVSSGSLTKGRSKSCGCLKYELWCARQTKHGHTKSNMASPEYTSFKGMKARCYNKNGQHYNRYGARGIRVCDRWLSEEGFKNFLADMGLRPTPKHTLDRIDNDGNYEPGNCCWATRKEQVRNRAWTVRMDGIPLSVLSEKHGIDHSVVLNRWHLGWRGDRLFSPPAWQKRSSI